MTRKLYFKDEHVHSVPITNTQDIKLGKPFTMKGNVVFKVIIAGGRDFNDYNTLKEYCDYILSKTEEPVEIVCGEARGADTLGKRYAIEKGYSIKSFPADWSKHGKSAGHIRNKQMAGYADALIAFWDGNSRGTKSMISYAHSYKLKIRIIKY